ncbi:MAG: hypothetical protein OIF58_11080 [Cohaesibacter sp.]|nr:hypothetical protein [Cohaesibacter sp.]
MSYTVNEMTGEVEVTLGGVIFSLRATLPNVAAFMAELQITGLRSLQHLLSSSDPRATYLGLKCLCVSDNKSELDRLIFGRDGIDASAALQAAVTAGMPGAEEAPGKQQGETIKSPGNA